MARKMRHSLVYTFILCLFFSTAQAQEKLDPAAFKKEGFGEVGDFLETLTPQQRETLIRGVEEQQKNINLTSEEQEALKNQLLELQNTIDFKEIDRSKIDKAMKENVEKLPETVEEYKALQHKK